MPEYASPEHRTAPVQIIGPESFPTPHRAYTFGANPSVEQAATIARIESFKDWHAEQANKALGVLLDTPHPTASTLRNVYDDITRARAMHNSGIDTYHDSRRTFIEITDDNPNRDRLGYSGRSRSNNGLSWSEEEQAFIGGEETPASRDSLELGKIALARFGKNTEGDIFQNKVMLPNGRVVDGNRIIRGNTAREYAKGERAKFYNRLRASGVPEDELPKFETGGSPVVFTETAYEKDRNEILTSVMDELATRPKEDWTPNKWADMVYRMYQSPQYKRGTDAVIRTFVVAVGAWIFGTPPMLVQNIDRLAYAASQQDFVQRVAPRALPHIN